MNISQCLYFPVARFPVRQSLVISSGFAIGINVILAAIASIGNVLVVLAVYRTRELRTNSNILIVFLAVTDQLVGVLVQPLFITFELMTILEESTDCAVIVVYTMSRVLCSILSLVTVLLISLERTLVIFKPLKYSTLVTRRRLIIFMFLIWIFWALLVSSRLIGMKTKNFRILVSAVIILCHISTGVTYLRIQRLASRHLKAIKAQYNNADRNNNSSRRHRENRALRTTTMIIGCIFLCYAPLVAVLVTNIVMGPKMDPWVSHITFTWADTMVYLNSALNPMIYCFRNAEFRRGISLVLGLRREEYYEEGTNNPNSMNGHASRSTATIQIAVSQISLQTNPVLLSLKNL